MWMVLEILRAHPKALNDPLLTGKDSLSYIYCFVFKTYNTQKIKGMICSYLMHGHDIIQVLKLCREERRKADFFCAV